MEEIVNRVAKSDIITLNLEDFYQHGDRVQIDIKERLFQGMVLREKDFRDFIMNTDWTSYQDKFVAIHCSIDAIIPTWAYMLLASSLHPYASKVVFGDLIALEQALFQEQLSTLDSNDFIDCRVVIKGCGHIPVPDFAYVELTRILRPVVQSIMYGEPCSTVPIYKRSKSKSGE